MEFTKELEAYADDLLKRELAQQTRRIYLRQAELFLRGRNRAEEKNITISYGRWRSPESASASFPGAASKRFRRGAIL